MTGRQTARTRWAKLDVDWYTDEVIVAAAEQEPCVYALWPVLVAMAKAASSEADNPSGMVRTTAKRLAATLHQDTEAVARAIEVMAEGELVEVERGRLGTLRITLAAFRKWQLPAGSDAERQAASRESRAGKKEPSVTGVSQVRHNVSQKCHLEGEGDREETHMSSSPASPVDFDLDAPCPTPQPQGLAVTAVFDHWKQAAGKTSRAKLTPQRRGKIVARLREGSTPRELMAVVDYYLGQPFYRGENDRAKAFDCLTVLLKNATKVAEALEAIDAKAGGGVQELSLRQRMEMDEQAARIAHAFDGDRGRTGGASMLRSVAS